MKRISILVVALIAMVVFACKNENTTNNTASTDTGTTATDTSSTSTTATDTSATTSTSGTTAVTSTAPLQGADKEFAMKAAEGGMTEVTLGQLAAAKATSNDVKDFGNRMVTDHGKAGDELKALAAQKGLTLPTGIGAEGQKTQTMLSSKSGAAFDKAYMSDMVKDHTKDVAEFQKAAKSVKDPDLKNWATNTLPVIQDHLKMAKEINGKLK